MAVAIPYIMVAAAVAGTAVSTYSAVRSGQEAQSAKEREAEQMRRSAEQSRLAAAVKAEDTRKLHEKLLSTQRARFGASGVEMEGSPLLVQLESMRESKDEIARIIEAGELGYGTSMYAADTALKTGEAAAKSGYVRATGELATGATTLSKTYKNWWETA